LLRGAIRKWTRPEFKFSIICFENLLTVFPQQFPSDFFLKPLSVNNSIFEYEKLCICYIGGIRILERLSWGMAQKRLGNTGIVSNNHLQ
jgi:hypothetical protein